MDVSIRGIHDCQILRKCINYFSPQGPGAVGHDETGDTRGRQVMDKVLNPSVIGVVHRRNTVFPAGVFPHALPTPVAHIKGWIGENEIGLEVCVQVVMKAVRMSAAQVGVNATDS